jgi:hypothetical protein
VVTLVASITAVDFLTRVKMETVTSSPRPRLLGWRARLCLAAGLCALYPLATAGTAAADDVVPTLPPLAQSATTDQGSAANGVVTQSGADNLVISIRIDSPGNDGPISQSNLATGAVGAGNGSNTSQAGAAQPGGSQQAGTGQEAGATGQVSQSQPKNVVISVRVNSPGNNGPIAQTNIAGVGVDAINGSATDQTGGKAAGETPRTAVPRARPLRHGAAPAEAARGTKTAAEARSSQPTPRRSAPASHPAVGQAEKSLGRPVSGAAAAQTAGFPAAAARASVKGHAPRHAAQAGALRRAAATVLGPVERVRLPAVTPPAGQRAEGAGLLTLSAVALLGALLVWLVSTRLGPLRSTRGRRA